jgi:cellulose synthase/poly-beta-1,6-N-acetylglucosamine synthase-like glycosyltransferase
MVDGGSADETLSLLKKYSQKHSLVKVFQAPGNRAVGRNFGVSKAGGKIIAFTDSGCIPRADWLEKLVRPFSDPAVKIVSGYYRGLAKNIFQKCLVPYVLVMPDAAGKTEFFPATRSMAIRKGVFQNSGGFDDNLYHNEDYAFAHKLKTLGFTFYFAPDAVVDWEPRKNLRSAAWMFMRFAIGDIQAGIYRPKVKLLAIRYLIFLFLIFLALEIPELFWLVGFLAGVYIIWSISKNFRYVKDIRAFYWLPVIQITADISVLFGTIMGLLLK